MVIASRKLDRLSKSGEEIKKNPYRHIKSDLSYLQCNIRKEEEVGFWMNFISFKISYDRVEVISH